MRVITTLCLFVFIFTSSKAQYNKGDKLVGGQFSLYSSKYKNDLNDNKSTSVAFSPSAAGFYKNNRLAGVSLSYSFTSFKEVPDAFSYGAGFFLRQYFPFRKSAFSFFAQESAAASLGKYNSSTSPDIAYRMKTFNANLSFAPAIAFAATKRLQLELLFPGFITLSYTNQKAIDRPDPGPSDYSQLYFSTGFTTGFSNLGVGMSLLF